MQVVRALLGFSRHRFRPPLQREVSVNLDASFRFVFFFFRMENDSYVEGDFILHFAGKKGRVREQLVEYYYPRAKKVNMTWNSNFFSIADTTRSSGGIPTSWIEFFVVCRIWCFTCRVQSWARSEKITSVCYHGRLCDARLHVEWCMAKYDYTGKVVVSYPLFVGIS